MNNSLTAQEVIAVARCLTQFQSDLTDYELTHYVKLTAGQRSAIEKALTALASTAGSLYAYSVKVEFAQAGPEIMKIQEAARTLKRFLKKAQKVQQVLDLVSTVADLADAIASADVEGITSGIDQVIQLIGDR